MLQKTRCQAPPSAVRPPAQTPAPCGSKLRTAGGKNIIRAAFLAFLATFAGCYLFYTLPDLVASLAGKVLPPVFYESQHQLLAVGTCLFNWVITAFYR